MSTNRGFTAKQVMVWVTIAALLASGAATLIAIVFAGSPGGAGPVAPPGAAPPGAAPSYRPVAADFDVVVTVTDVRCAAAQDCRYSYDVRPAYLGPAGLTPEPLVVTFEVVGGHTPQLRQFLVSNGQARFDNDMSLLGAQDAVLSATVLRVD